MTIAKNRRRIALIVFVLLAIQNQLGAQDNRDEHHWHHHYKFVHIGTFGGPNVGLAVEPIAQILSPQGIAVGEANTSTPNPYYPNVNPFLGLGVNVGHAFAWQNGALVDLGTLPGGVNSGADWISHDGLIAGVSENGEIDPLLGVPQGIAVIWYDGKIINLGTLDGGYESVANSVNIWGQVTGPALNTVPDLYSMLGLGTQTRAYVWELGKMKDLGTLGGPDAFGVYINDQGQIAGSSYTDWSPNAATGLPTQDPFLWENGKMLDLGSLGGVYGVANALNNLGEVVGQSNLTGDQAYHAYLWNRSRKMQDLGTLGGNFSTATWANDAGQIVGWSTLPGDQLLHASAWKSGAINDLGALENFACSTAKAINSSGQIVGEVDDCISVEHAALWDQGSVIDLNTFVPKGSGIVLEEADYINDRGEIIGYALLPNGDEHGYLLIPCDDDHPGVEDCDYSMVEASTTQTSPLQLLRPGISLGPLHLRDPRPGAWNRVRRAQPSTLPLGAQAETSLPVQKCSSDTITNNADLLAGWGHCAEANGKLGGLCVIPARVGPGGCPEVPSSSCHSGAKAKKPGLMECCGLIACSKRLVDLDSLCR